MSENMQKNSFKEKYDKEIKSLLFKELQTKSIMQVPKIKKIVLNMGLGEVVSDKSVIKDAMEELALISGQVPLITKSKKSNASFKIREGMPIGVKVTLRGKNMYNFLYKLINVALPRIRDFRGVSPKSFDGFGNYSLGVKELIIFPEIDLDKVKVMKGLDITIVTSSNNDAHNYELLLKFGMPFNGVYKKK